MKKKAFLMIILAGLLWGTSGIFVHFLAPYGFSSMQMTLFRSLVSVLLISLYALVKDRGIFKAKPAELLLFFGSGLSFFGTAACYYFSMQATSVSTAVVLMYLAPVIVLFYSVAFLGEKMTKVKSLAIVSMLIGCGLVSGIIGGLRFDVFGICMGFLSGISYGAYNIFTKIEMRRGSRPLTASLYSFIFAALIAFCFCKPETIPANVLKDAGATIVLIIGMGVLTSVLPYVFYTTAMKHIQAGTASALGIVEPMAATVYSVLLFSEKLTVFSIIGIIMNLISVFLLGKSEE